MPRKSTPVQKSPQKTLPGWIGWLILVLNGYYLVRFLIAAVNLFQVLSLQSLLALAIAIGLAAALVFLGISGRFAAIVTTYSDRKSAILEIFVFYLLLGQVVDFALGLLTSGAAFEIRGWFIANLLGLVICVLILKARPLFPITPLLGEHEKRAQGSLLERVYRGGILLIILCIAGYWTYTQLIAPLPGYFNYDPEYSYMLTALTPFKDTGLYARLDHPGTLMQLIGSGIDVLISPRTLPKAGYPIYLPVIDPRIFITLARLVVLVGTLGGILLLSVKAIRPHDWTDLFAGLSIALIYFASQSQALEFTRIWSPNSFYFAAGTSVLVLLLSDLNREDQGPERYLQISLLAGLIGTFHVYLITWCLPVLSGIFLYFLLHGDGLKKAFLELGKSLLNYAMGYLLGFLVIADQLESFLDWLFGVATHSGYYGEGAQGFTNLGLLQDNFQQIIQAYPVLLAAAGILLAGFLLVTAFASKQIKRRPGAWGLALGIMIQVFAILLLVLKQPWGRYLLSMAALLPVLLAAILVLLQSYPRTTCYIYPALFILLVGLFSLNLGENITSHQERATYAETYQREVEVFLERYSSSLGLEPAEIEKYWTYGSYSECHSLWFGNEYAKNLFTEEIEEQCAPTQNYSISLWSGKIIPDRTKSIEELGPNTVIIGNPNRLLESLDLDRFQEHRSQALPDLSFFTPLDIP